MRIITGYFRGMDVTDKPEIIVPVFERSLPEVDEPIAPTPIAPATNTPVSLKLSKSNSTLRFPNQYGSHIPLLCVSLAACLVCASFVMFPGATSIAVS